MGEYWDVRLGGILALRLFFFFQAEDGIRDHCVTGVQTCALPIYGQAVGGLTRGDFELYVNGKPQPVDYFDVLDFGSLPATAAADPRQRRMYLFADRKSVV